MGGPGRSAPDMACMGQKRVAWVDNGLHGTKADCMGKKKACMHCKSAGQKPGWIVSRPRRHESGPADYMSCRKLMGVRLVRSVRFVRLWEHPYSDIAHSSPRLLRVLSQVQKRGGSVCMPMYGPLYECYMSPPPALAHLVPQQGRGLLGMLEHNGLLHRHVAGGELCCSIYVHRA